MVWAQAAISAGPRRVRCPTAPSNDDIDAILDASPALRLSVGSVWDANTISRRGHSFQNTGGGVPAPALGNPTTGGNWSSIR